MLSVSHNSRLEIGAIVYNYQTPIISNAILIKSDEALPGQDYSEIILKYSSDEEVLG